MSSTELIEVFVSSTTSIDRDFPGLEKGTLEVISSSRPGSQAEDQLRLRSLCHKYNTHRTLETLHELAAYCSDVLRQEIHSQGLSQSLSDGPRTLKTYLSERSGVEIIAHFDEETSETTLLLRSLRPEDHKDMQVVLTSRNRSNTPPFTDLKALLEHLERGENAQSTCTKLMGWAPLIMEMIQIHLDSTRDLELEVTLGSGQLRIKCLQTLLLIHHHDDTAFPPSIHIKTSLKKKKKRPSFKCGYSSVWEGVLDENQNVGLKVLDRGKMSKEDVSHEVFIWRQLQHPNILKFLGINTELFAPRICIISPWMAKNDIRSYSKDLNLSREAKINLIYGVAKGILYLHEHNPPIVHGDIKAANILVTDRGESCITDFGLCAVNGSRIKGRVRGTLYWMAPELLIPPHELEERVVFHSLSGDIYSLGCTIYEIIVGRVPFSELSEVVRDKTEAEVEKFLKNTTIPDMPKDREGSNATLSELIDCAVTESVRRAYSNLKPNTSKHDFKERLISSAAPEAFYKSIMSIVLHGYRPEWPIPAVCDDWLSSGIVEQCWQEKASDRPDARKVLCWLEDGMGIAEGIRITQSERKVPVRLLVGANGGPGVVDSRSIRKPPRPDHHMDVSNDTKGILHDPNAYPPPYDGPREKTMTSAGPRTKKPTISVLRILRKLVPCLPG